MKDEPVLTLPAAGIELIHPRPAPADATPMNRTCTRECASTPYRAEVHSGTGGG